MFKDNRKDSTVCRSIYLLHLVSLAPRVLVARNEVGCEVDIRKIRHCSNAGSDAADNLSKSAFASFKETATGYNPLPDMVPPAFLSWTADPVPDRFLGRRIVRH